MAQRGACLVGCAFTCIHPRAAATVAGLHFYTLNLERSVRLILDGLKYTETAATRRMYPWRASALSKRAAEDVRSEDRRTGIGRTFYVCIPQEGVRPRPPPYVDPGWVV